jgi:putative inorganic carbon (HCO3(-)) transporter
MNKDKISYYILLFGIIAIPFDIVWKVNMVRMTLAEILLSLGMLLTLIDVARYHRNLLNKKYLIPVLVFLAACALSIIAAQNKLVAMRETLQFVWMCGLFLYILNESQKRNIFYPLAAILISIAAVISVVGLYQYFFVREPIHFLINATRLRAHGFYAQPNTLGGFLSGIIPLLFGLYFISFNGSETTSNFGWIKRYLYNKSIILTALFIISAGLMVTYSRASWIGLFGGILVLAYTLRKKISWKRYIIPVGIIGMLTVVLLLDVSRSHLDVEESIIDNLVADRGFSNSQRSMLIGVAISIIRDHPIGGVGIGNFQSRLPEYASPELINSMLVDYNDSTKSWYINHNKKFDVEIVHNMPLQVVVETGIVGLAALLWVFFIYFRAAFARLKIASTTQELFIRNALLVSVIAILISGLFGWPFSHGIQEVMIINMALSVSRWS